MDLENFTWDETVEGSIIDTPETTSKEKDLFDTSVEIESDKKATVEPKGKVVPEEEVDEELEAVKNSLFSSGEETAIFSLNEEEEEVFNNETDPTEGKEKNETATNPEDKDEKPSTAGVKSVSNLSTLSFLSEQGVLEFEDEDHFEGELDEDTALDMINLGLDRKVDAKIRGMMEGLDNMSKQAVEFLAKGGDLNKLASMLNQSNNVGLKPDMDLEQEDNQILAAKYKLQDMDEDEDVIEAFIDKLKEKGKLKDYAAKAFAEWEEDREAPIQEELKDKEEARKKAIKNSAEYRTKIKNALNENKDFNGYKVSKKDSAVLLDYLSKPSEKLADNRVVTGFQKDFAEAMKDPAKQVLIASLIKNDFNFDTVIKKASSKTTRSIKEEMQRQKKTTVSSSGSSQKPIQRLTDFL